MNVFIVIYSFSFNTNLILFLIHYCFFKANNYILDKAPRQYDEIYPDSEQNQYKEALQYVLKCAQDYLDILKKLNLDSIKGKRINKIANSILENVKFVPDSSKKILNIVFIFQKYLWLEFGCWLNLSEKVTNRKEGNMLKDRLEIFLQDVNDLYQFV